MRVEPAQVRAVVGGSGFLHRGSLALLVPTSLLTSLLSRPIAAPRDALGWTVANALAFLLCWALVEIADRTAFRRRTDRPVAVPLVVAFGALLGAIKGAGTDLAGAAIGLGAPSLGALAWRSLGTATLGAVAIPALAALHVGVERYRTEHALLVAQHLRRLDRDLASGARSSELDALTSSLRDALAKMSPATAASSIRALVEGSLRPVMEAIWSEGSRAPERLNVRSLGRLTITRNPFPVLSVAIAYTLSILPTSIELTGPGVGVLRSLLAGLTLAITLLLAREARPSTGGRDRRSAVLGAGHLLMTVVIATAVQMLQWDLLLGGMPRASTGGLRITVAVWIAVLLLVGGGVAIALRERSVLRDELLRAVGPDVLREVALRDHDRLLAQRVATRLHADVQGRMLAAARRIEQDGHGPQVVDDELRALDALLRDIPERAWDGGAGSLEERLAALIRRWDGFIAISLHLDLDGPGSMPEVPIGAGSEGRIVQVVSEAVVNAFRHGLARTAAVEIREVPDGVEVVVVDDGIGPRDGAPGLGSASFDAASAGAWSLRPGAEGGSVLRLLLSG